MSRRDPGQRRCERGIRGRLHLPCQRPVRTQEDRASLLERLADSLMGDGQAEIDEAWRDQILQRVEQVRKGEVTLERWEDVRRAGREALARR